jgi:hypothetical protein
MSRARLFLTFFVFLTPDARAQRVQLELRPKAGDTLRMRLDQVTEMTGSRKGGTAMKPVTTTLRMFSRAIVESNAVGSAMILAVTDSVEVSSTDEHTRSFGAETQRQLKGRQMRLRLATDGTVTIAADQSTVVPKEVNDLVAVMPASFPREAVTVGQSWVREMPIGSGSSLGVPTGGMVRATFRLDSLSASGDLAYVSMRGMLEPGPAQAGADQGLGGSVDGNMVVNRRRGWLSESRFLVQMSTTVTRGAARAPVQFRMRITQHMRVFDKR